MIITNTITEACISASVQSEDKEELFAEMVEILVRGTPGMDRDAVLQAITERESKMSTGIGKGVAIPHGKTDAVSALCGVIGISKKGIDYEALDGEPVHVIFMLLAPASSAGAHIKALQRIGTLMKDRSCYQKLCDAKTSGEVFQILRSEEERMGDVE
jgi:mannitol/fructose-specific phosphotransferase system IIA component (Ntr-type)